MVRKGRRRLAAPMYDVGCTTVADGVCPCTMYDVRCTIAELARVARGGEALAAVIDEAGSGHGSKGAGAPGGAYVRCGMYEVNYNFEAG